MSSLATSVWLDRCIRSDVRSDFVTPVLPLFFLESRTPLISALLEKATGSRRGTHRTDPRRGVAVGWNRGRIHLVRANERYGPRIIGEEVDNFELIGVVVGRSGISRDLDGAHARTSLQFIDVQCDELLIH